MNESISGVCRVGDSFVVLVDIVERHFDVTSTSCLIVASWLLSAKHETRLGGASFVASH